MLKILGVEPPQTFSVRLHGMESKKPHSMRARADARLSDWEAQAHPPVPRSVERGPYVPQETLTSSNYIRRPADCAKSFLPYQEPRPMSLVESNSPAKLVYMGLTR